MGETKMTHHRGVSGGLVRGPTFLLTGITTSSSGTLTQENNGLTGWTPPFPCRLEKIEVAFLNANCTATTASSAAGVVCEIAGVTATTMPASDLTISQIEHFDVDDYFDDTPNLTTSDDLVIKAAYAAMDYTTSLGSLYVTPWFRDWSGVEDV